MAFQHWLVECLNKAGIDGEVYGDYIEGTLDTMKTSNGNELKEALLEILEGYMDDSQECKRLCDEILSVWGDQREEEEKKASDEVLSVQPAKLIPESSTSKSKNENVSDQEGASGGGGMTTEEKMKLLSQYDCESDEEIGELHSTGKEPGLFLNQNAAVVSEASRLHRVKLKAEHDARMERTKLDREKQKQKAQDRKEKEKKRTQKQERRR